LSRPSTVVANDDLESVARDRLLVQRYEYPRKDVAGVPHRYDHAGGETMRTSALAVGAPIRARDHLTQVIVSSPGIGTAETWRGGQASRERTHLLRRRPSRSAL
jgi:hypothetical protein